MNITAKRITEKEYRKIPKNSYSSIKLFIEDRKKYYREIILGEPRDNTDTYATIFGRLCETLLWEPDQFEDRFILSSVNPPTGQILDFTTNLYELTKQCMDENGEVTRDMEVLLQEAFDLTKYDRSGAEVAFKGKTLEKALEKFIGTDAELYYRQLRNSTNKTVISLSTIENAEKVVTELKTNFATKDILNLVSDSRYEIYNQLPLEFEYNGYELKFMSDRLEIDHQEKIIQPDDLKISHIVEEFNYNFLKYYYYLQNVVYYEGVKAWAKANGYESYEVKPLRFIVADSINYMNPLVHITTMKDIEMARKGFKLKNGKFYMGLDQALEEIAWHTENTNWRISKSCFLNNGRKMLDLQYDEKN